MIVHWEQLDERERAEWLALVSEADLAEHRRALEWLDEINRDARRFGTLFRPWRLVTYALVKIRLTVRLTRFIRRIRSYERSLGLKYDPGGPAGATQRVTLIGFLNLEPLRDVELRASREVRGAVDEIVGAG